MRKFFFTLCAISIAAAFTSCKKENDAPAVTKTIVLPVNGASVIDASNKFAFNFLHAVLQQDNNNDNKLISPLSIYMALSMVYNGADNGTKDSIAKTLALSGIDINDLNSVCNALITQLPGEDNKVQLSIANSIWYSKNNFQPLNAFLATVQDDYTAAVQPLNFSDPASVNTINNWVANETNNKIEKIIDNISADDLMYLINAIYFKGDWQCAFPASNTHNDNFYLPGGSMKQVPFMEQTTAANFYNDTLFTMVELPYGGGKGYSMYIALPKNAQQSVSTFTALMNEDIIANAINNMDSKDVRLEIPKWSYTYSINDMKQELALLGMGTAFSDSADFSKMYNASQINPSITKAVHKTYISVDEHGTEAAAVTGIGAGVTSAGPFLFKPDRPFLYVIIEKQTSVILFAGILNNPSVN